MKRHAGSPGSTTNRVKRREAKAKAREREIRRAHNVLTMNTSLAQRARRREEAS